MGPAHRRGALLPTGFPDAVIPVCLAACLAACLPACSAAPDSGKVTGNPPGALCQTSEAFPSPLRRLNRVEYDNTARDLLGFDLSPAAKFPPDEVAGGFSNNASVLTVSPLLAEKYLEAAEALALEASKNLPALLPCDPAAMGEEACARQFVTRFGRRAYRRPLQTEEIDRLMTAYAAGRAEGSFAAGIELVITAALQSPNFLYRFEFGGTARPGDKLVRLTSVELASRLSYFLWGSMPDERLSSIADAGGLNTGEAIAREARLLLDDARARPAMGQFYRQWLGLGAIDTVIKDPAVHPEFTAELRAAMRAETPAFVDHVLWSGDRRLRTLFTSPLGFAAAPLAALYGVPASSAGVGPASAPMVMLDPAQRAGILTHAGVLAVHALPNQSSPVSRGKFIREQILCQDAPPPPPNLMVTPPEVDATRTTRERFAQHTTDATCASCHELMDPIGFGLEAYDAIGRHRATDGGRPVDEAGWIAKSKDIDGPFRGARELGEKLSASAQVSDCVATQWFRYAMGRFDANGDLCSLTELRAAFTASGGDMRELLVALTQTESFVHRRVLVANEVSP